MKREELFNGNDNNRSIKEIDEMRQYLEKDESFIRECLRHKISSLLMDTDENHPINIEVIIGDEEAVGLSSLMMLRVVKAFQEPSEGIIYFTLDGSNQMPIEFDNPMFSINDLLDIAGGIEYEVKK